MRRSLVSTWAVLCAVAAAAPAAPQVLEVATLNTDQVRGLDRQKTAVIMPGGILEEHGPYLPSYADGYYKDTHGGRMVHLLGGMDAINCCSAWKKLAPQEALAEDGLTVHAGLAEHSAILFLRPDLVPPAFRQARSVTADGFPALEAAAKAADWPGYFGAPRHATSALGAAFYHEDSRHFIDYALQVLDGQEGTAVPRYADTIVGNPVIRGIVVDALAHDAAREARQHEWLAEQPAWPPPPTPPR